MKHMGELLYFALQKVNKKNVKFTALFEQCMLLLLLLTHASTQTPMLAHRQTRNLIVPSEKM